MYILPHNRWPEPIPEGHILMLLRCLYGTTKQAARRWHLQISGWMKKIVILQEKTIFMKHLGNIFIIHCLFVDDIIYVPTSDALKKNFMKLKKNFMKKYTRDFDITGGQSHGDIFWYAGRAIEVQDMLTP